MRIFNYIDLHYMQSTLLGPKVHESSLIPLRRICTRCIHIYSKGQLSLSLSRSLTSCRSGVERGLESVAASGAGEARSARTQILNLCGRHTHNVHPSPLCASLL